MTPGTSLRHNALLYGDVGEYLAVTAPYLRAGLEAGDAVFAVVPRPRSQALRETLGRDGRDVTFIDAEVFYQHPVRALHEYDRVMRAHAPRRLRVVGENIWPGDRTETMEWVRYESLVNAVFAASGAQVICAYDRTAVDAEIIGHARRTHPWLIDGRAEYASGEYAEPAGLGTDSDRVPRTPPPSDAQYLPFGSEQELYQVRRFVAARASGHGLDGRRVVALETAVTEVATNALKHGAPPMGVRVWTRPGEFVCEVGDHGRWRPGAPAGLVPPGSALDSGFGLWTVRLLMDRVWLYAGRDGTFVRMVVRP
ncbi:Anti-sigma regulatory factor (Ser/Thr protein kinase) [Thermomonospora echinospora]|uniref:Anti-sigma regulatory factor (Ser/Thr protein kinase) n=1 Tax=Thermomonospora echinospora TaxID=1992 RepID=A0A1H5VRI5_9ACTN|nr:sensor histidine kinase [Thermomonospora echinospora]SEF89892.1 Anti-sigma regulatory factor (Ser/Thr protein kinase) [Thermomonospora echinospora]